METELSVARVYYLIGDNLLVVMCLIVNLGCVQLSDGVQVL